MAWWGCGALKKKVKTAIGDKRSHGVDTWMEGSSESALARREGLNWEGKPGVLEEVRTVNSRR